MNYWTYAEIRDKVRRDLGIEQETFVTDDELLGYVNAGIDNAEAEIHGLYEDYFLTRGTISLVSGQAGYDMPTNIYANKIRGLVYKSANKIYEVRRFKGRNNTFLELELSKEYDQGSTSYFEYILRNDSETLGVQLHMVPTPDSNETDALIVWYLRNAARMVDATSVCDIPEFVHYVIQYAKVRCMEKESHPDLPGAVGILEHFRSLMIGTLTDMTPDGDNEIEKDMTFYSDMSEDYYGPYGN